MDLVDRLYSALCGLRDGGLAGAKASDRTVLFGLLRFHSRAIVGSAKVCLVVDLRPELYSSLDISPFLDSLLRQVTAIQASLNDWWEGGRRALYSIRRSIYAAYWFRVALDEEPSYTVVVTAVVLLSLVYQYLTGNVDTGSSKAYSRSSLDFRDIFVAVVLFLGAYVWIKFREVALRGVHPRKRVDKQGRTKVVYDARLTPPKWNGRAVPKLELGQFATEQEAHTKFRIAAFYYNRDAGLLDGGFQVPPMSEEERSLAGLEFRAWVTVQAKKVYEDFQKKEAALLLHELLEDEVTPEQDEVNVDFSIANLLNSAEHHQPALVSQVENLEMDMAMPDDQGLECAPHSFGGMHEGVALSNVRSLGFEEGSALPVSQLPPNTESGMSMNGSDHWDLLQALTSEASLLNSAKHCLPLLGSQAENSRMAIDMQPMLADQGLECTSQSFGGMHEGLVPSHGHSVGFQEDSAIPISQLTPDTQSGMCMNISNQLNLLQIVHNQQELITYLQQQLQESRIRVSQLESQNFVEQQLQVINEGVPSFELEMERRMLQQNHPCSRLHGSAFW